MPSCCMTRLKPRATLARSGCFGPSWSLTAQLYSARRPIASRHRRASKRRWTGGTSRQTGTAASNGCMPLSWYWATQQRFRCERRSRRRYHYADQYHSLESGNRGRRNCWRPYTGVRRSRSVSGTVANSAAPRCNYCVELEETCFPC